jgi:hypothetical protein
MRKLGPGSTELAGQLYEQLLLATKKYSVKLRLAGRQLASSRICSIVQMNTAASL